jgi:hypothetical protein
VSTPAQDLHVSGCLDGLRPGDNFEIQWRKNKDFPYGMHHADDLWLIAKSALLLTMQNSVSVALGNR